MEQLIVEETITSILHNIADSIFTNNARITDSGLLTGKMGIAIFLFNYGKCYNNAVCTQLADDIIKDIRINMNGVNSIDYYNGLSGIDAGLKYLLKNGFIDTGMAEIPEMAEQAIYNGFLNFPKEQMHDRLYRLSGLGKYFAQDYRIRSLTTTGPFSMANRKCVSHLIGLLGLLDVNQVLQLDHKDVLRMTDVFSRLISTGYLRKEISQFFSHSLRGLETILFGNKNFKPFTNDCNPFCIAYSLFKIYERTTRPDFATLAIHVLETYERAVDKIYQGNETGDYLLLQHVIACKKLHVILKEDGFNNYAEDCLEFYKKRKRSNMQGLQYDKQVDFSLQNGYAGEGMALLTLDGGVQMDWFDDLL